MSDLQARLQTALGSAYHVERELGGGGMSRVYVAEEVSLARKVVVKVLPPEMAAGVNAERFRREIQLAASLQHPHIVPLLNAGQSGDVVWYTMPLIEGESLRARLARDRELPVAEAVRLLRDVADALAYAHEHGVVHRDIKPDNVLITRHHAVVTDFGVAKAISAATGASHLTSIGVALGTPAYMAPEQAAAEPHVDHRADLYALGAMAYEMLSGAPPFEGSPQAVLAAHVTQPPAPVTTRRAAVPAALATLVMRCLEKKAADRWQSAAELHQQLDQMATPSGGTTPTTAVLATPSRRTLRGGPLTWGIVAAAVVVLAVGAYATWRTRASRSPVRDVREPVLVLPFEARVTSPGLKDIGEIAADRIEAAIQEATISTVTPRRTVVSAIESSGLSPEVLSRIARTSGAGTVVTGTIYERGPVTDPGRGINAETQQVLGAVAFYLAPESRGYDVTLYRPPSSLELFRVMNRADRSFYQSKWAGAIAQYTEALRRDTSEFRVAAWLSSAYANQGLPRQSDSMLAFLSARRGRFTRGEALGFNWLDAVRRSPEEEYRAAMAAFATDPIGWSYSAMYSSVRSNRPAEALRYYRLRDTTSVFGQDWQPWHNVAASALHALGRYKDELALAREARARQPDYYGHLATQCRALIGLGRMNDVEQLIVESRAYPGRAVPGRLMHSMAFELFAHGRQEEARRMWERALDWHLAQPTGSPEEESIRSNLANEHYYLGHYREAGQLYAELARRYPSSGAYGRWAALVATRIGDTATALRSVAEFRSDSSRASPARFMAARILAVLGRREEAVAALRDWLNVGGRVSGGFHASSPDFEGLRQYPPYLALVALKD